MAHLETVARNIPSISKVMLTCFVSNVRAREFYRKIGFEPDPWSPGPRLLRGKTIEPDYVILAKNVEVQGADEKTGEPSSKGAKTQGSPSSTANEAAGSGGCNLKSK